MLLFINFLPVHSLSLCRAGHPTGEPPALLGILRDVFALRVRLRLLLQLAPDLEGAEPKLVAANAARVHLHDAAGM